jgi:hypothetical protein
LFLAKRSNGMAGGGYWYLKGKLDGLHGLELAGIDDRQVIELYGEIPNRCA